MSDFCFAGLAIFPAGVEEYNLSFSLMSSTGSVVDNKSCSSPADRISLQETIRSTFASTIPKAKTIRSYFSSVPPAFPPDRYYDVVKALRLSGLIEKWDTFPFLPLNHAEAFAALLPKGKTISVLALDFYSPPHLHVAMLSSTEANWKRANTMKQELSVPLAHVDSFQGILEKIKSSLDPNGTNEILNPDQIMLIKPLIATNGSGAVDIDAVVAELYPNIPVSIVTPTDIAQAAASFAYTNSRVREPHRLVQYCMALPMSVATASGAAVPLSTGTSRIPTSLFVILTNSVDNQKSATVRLMLGNHVQTKNNIQRAVVVLDGLKPLPKGEARIKVLIRILAMDGWRQAIRVSVEQKDGPKRKFLFPRFFANLPQDYEEKYDIAIKNDTEYPISRHNVVGKLPE